MAQRPIGGLLAGNVNGVADLQPSGGQLRLGGESPRVSSMRDAVEDHALAAVLWRRGLE